MALQGFVESEYLAAKLAALQTKPEWVGKTTDQLKAYLANAGFTPESHYQQFGWKEGLAPNNLFNAAEYKLAKATQLFNKGLTEGGTPYASIDAALTAFEAAWTADPYLHYVQFGTVEGVNPSNAFDESSYLASKLAQLQATNPTVWTADKTAADVQAAFAAAGLSALGHYEAFGKTEGIAVTQVPVDEQVDVGTVSNPGETFTLTTGQDTILGTAADDIINGFINWEVAAGNTLNSGDQIDGSSGRDTLNVTVEYNTDNDLYLNMQNVEKMVIRDFDGQTFYTQAVTGLDTVSNVNSTAGTYFEDGTYIIPNIEFHNATSYFYQDAGNVAVIDTLNVLVDNSSVEVYQYSDNVAEGGRANYKTAVITSIGEGMEVDAAGNHYNYLYLGESRGASSVTVTGTTDIELDIEHFQNAAATAGTVSTVDASTLEGGLFSDLYFFGVAGDVKTVKGGMGDDKLNDYASDKALAISYDLGTGDDTVTINGGITNKYTVLAGAGDDMVTINDSSNAVIKGDAGDDTVNIGSQLYMNALGTGFTADLDGGEGDADTFGITATNALASEALLTATVTDFSDSIVGFEVLSLTGVAAVPAATVIDATLWQLGDNVILDGASDFELIVNDAATVEVTGAVTTALAITVDGADAATSLTDSLTVEMNGVDGITLAALNVADVETISLISSASDPALVAPGSNVVALTAAAATTLNVSGETALDMTGSVLAAVKTVDAADFDAGLTIDVSSSVAKVAITTGDGADIVVGSAQADTISVGNGGNTVTGGLGLDTITLGAGVTADDVDSILYGLVTESQGVTVDVISGFQVAVQSTDDTTGDGLVTAADVINDVIDLSAVALTGVGSYVGEANGYGAVLTSLAFGSSNAVLDITTSILYIDVTADGILDNTDMAIQLTGVTEMSADNFVF